MALPVPAEPEHRGRKGKPGGSVRPMAGPVVPLTGANVGSEQVLLGGPNESPGATVGLSAGEAVAAPADDFGWPRGEVNVEQAVVEPAVPDRRQIRQARPAQVGNGCLRRSNGPGAEAGPAPAAASSQSQCVGSPAPELSLLRVKWLVRYSITPGKGVPYARVAWNGRRQSLLHRFGTSVGASPTTSLLTQASTGKTQL